MYISRIVKLVLEYDKKLYNWDRIDNISIMIDIVSRALSRKEKGWRTINVTKIEKIWVYNDFKKWYAIKNTQYIFRRVNEKIVMLNTPNSRYYDPIEKVEIPETLSDWGVIKYNLDILKYVGYPISEDTILRIYSEIVLGGGSFRQTLTIDQKLKNCRDFEQTYDYRRFILYYRSSELNETLKKEVVDGIAKKIDIFLTKVSRLYVKFIYFFKRK